MLLDGRQFRSDQACGDVVAVRRSGLPGGRRPGAHDARRRRRSSGSASSSRRRRRRGPVIAQQTVLTDLRCRNGAILNYDQWDGYAPARDRLLAAGGAAPIGSSCSPATSTSPASGRLPGVGVEFVTDVDLVDRQRAGRPRSRPRRLPRRRRRRARPPRLHPPHRHARDVDGRVPHRRRRGHARLAGVDVEHVRRRRRADTRRRHRRSDRANIADDGRRTRHRQRTDRRPAARRDDRRQPRRGRSPPTASNDAIVARHQGIRWTLRRLRRPRRRAAAPGCSASASRSATGSACGARTTPSGRCCSTPRPTSASSSSTSTRRTGPTSWPTPSTSRDAGCCSPPRRSRTSDYIEMVEQVDGRGPGARADRVPLGGRVGRDRRRRRRRRPATRWPGGRRPGARRPDQHPVHVGHHGVPQGRHAHPPQHPQQRLLRRPPAGVQPAPTGCASRCPSTTASAW